MNYHKIIKEYKEQHPDLFLIFQEELKGVDFKIQNVELIKFILDCMIKVKTNDHP